MVQSFLEPINDFNIGESINISIDNEYGLRNELVFYIRNDQDQYQQIGTRNNVPNSYKLEFSESEINAMYNAKVNSAFAVFKVELNSYDGSTYIGQDQSSCLATIIDADPYFTSDAITFKDINPLTLRVTGDENSIIRSLSKISVKFPSANAVKGANIQSYEIYFNDSLKVTETSANEINIGEVDEQGGQIRVRVIDSRYNTAIITVDVPIINYFTPFPIVAIKRQFNYKAETHIYPDVDFPSVNGLNKIDIVYRMREVNGEFGAEIPIENKVDTVVQLDQNKVFEFEFKVTDVFNTTSMYSYFVGKGVFPMFIDTTNNSVGINTFPDKLDALRVAGGWATSEDGFKVETKYSTYTGRTFYLGDSIIAENETIVDGKPVTESSNFKIIADYFEFYRNSFSVTPLLEGGDDGGDFIRSLPTYNRVYSESPNVFITPYGTFGRSTSSSIRYKKDIKDIRDDDGFNPEMLLHLPVKTYRYKPEFEPIDKPSGTRYAGFIAEDVAKLYPPATEYNEKGEVEMWSMKDIIPPMLALIQANYKEIESLKREIQKLKGGDAK